MRVCNNTYKARCFDVAAGINVAVLNDETAEKLNIEQGDRVLISYGKKEVLAVADLSDKYVKTDEISLFADVSSKLGNCEGKQICVEKAQRPQSLDYIRKKLDGITLTEAEIGQIIDDLMVEHFSVAELSAFVTAVYIRGLSPDEIVGLTKAMVRSGQSMSFPKSATVASEHSIGGVAGDRVSMLIVPIVASCGVIIPKTASRAISSASGTADAMEVLAPVELTREQVEKVATKTGGALVWGGGVNIAIADDKLIQVRHPLRLDPSGLLLSSILAKKKAEGAKHVLLDIPVGRGSKIDDLKEANSLANSFKMLSSRLGMSLNCIITDGSEPAMNSIGPSLEARAVLETLADGGKSNPQLAEKAVIMSGVILQMAKGMDKDKAYCLARKQLESGKADEKFREIIKAQGGNPDIRASQVTLSKEKMAIKSKVDGKVGHIDNKAIFRLCRALGAPSDKKAGIMLKVKKEQRIRKGEVVFEAYSSSPKALAYVCSRMDEYPVVEIEKVILDMI
jgi:AMP phosphorylase